MRILVCGGRFYANEKKVFNVLDKAKSVFGEVHIIHGAASGADTLAQKWATSRNVPFTAFPADWKQYNKRAGFIRNMQMLQAKPDLVIAFAGLKGTQMMVDLANKANVPVRQIQEDPNDILKD